MRPVLVIKTGTTLPELLARRGDYEAWILGGMGIAPEQAQIASVFEGAGLPDPDGLSGVVVTGSSAMVSDREPWSERTGIWLAGAIETELPVLGICYGHQLLAQALGGVVGANPRGREIGTIDIATTPEARDDALLRELPPALRMQATHVESVLELPKGARLLTTTPLDPHHGFAIGERAWGIQFHPEFDVDVMRTYLRYRRELIDAEGLEADALLESSTVTPHGPELLRAFARLLRP